MLRSNAATVRSLVRERNSPPPVRSTLPEKQGKPGSCVLGRGAVTQMSRHAELEALDLPRRRLGEAFHELDPAGVLERGQPVLDEALQPLGGGFGAGLEHEERLRPS